MLLREGKMYYTMFVLDVAMRNTFSAFGFMVVTEVDTFSSLCRHYTQYMYGICFHGQGVLYWWQLYSEMYHYKV